MCLVFDEKRKAYYLHRAVRPSLKETNALFILTHPKDCQAVATAYRAANRGTPRSAHIFVMNGQGCGFSRKPRSRNPIVPPGCFAVPPAGGLCLLAVGTDDETADTWIPVYPNRASARRASRPRCAKPIPFYNDPRSDSQPAESHGSQ